MPQYRYEVKKGPGESTTGTLEADSQRAAVARLRDLGYYPIRVEEDTARASRGSVRRALQRVRLKDRNILFRQLATLYDSGVPLTQALSTIAQQTPNAALRAIVDQVREDVQKGATLAEAFERHPRTFSPLHCALVRAGESGGMLDQVLWRNVAYGERDEELRGRVVTALIYPVFLFLMGSISVFILVSFVFPKFMMVFDDFQATLPLQTRAVLAFCGFMDRFWWAVLIVLVVTVALALYLLRSEPGRFAFDRFVLRVPVLRTLVEKYVVGQFARTLGTLLDNGVPVLAALRITTGTLSNRAIASEVSRIEQWVAEGEGISAGLRRILYFPPMVINMFAVGEESGQIGAVTKRIADAYDVEVDRAVKAFTALLEPALIVVMGVFVGYLVIAMLLPILTLSSTQL